MKLNKNRDFQEIVRDCNELISWNGTRESKYRRNYNRYSNNGIRRVDLWQNYAPPLGYYNVSPVDDTGFIPAINVIRSCIETHISKLSQTKVRPFFNPIAGTYKTTKVCRAAQVFFDEFYDAQKVYKLGVECVRDAEIFDQGHLYIDDINNRLTRIAPWEYYVDPAEVNFGKVTRCMVRRKQYPLIYLKDRLTDQLQAGNKLQNLISAKGEYIIYYDLVNKERIEIIDNEELSRDRIDYDVSPVVSIYYTSPVRGGQSTSLADNIYSIQTEIDVVSQRIHSAVELSPANMIFVPKQTDVKASTITNRIGAIFEFNQVPGAGASPVTVSTPAPIDAMYKTLLEFYENKAYQMEGISQLSAQSKKPTGINSGVALDTLEDIESERHNVILQNYIGFLMDVAKTCIEVFPETVDVLPQRTGRAKVSWKDVKKQKQLYNIQFSASSSLSKDPKTKLEQIEKLQSMNLINPSIAASLLEFPDLEGAYSIMNASYDSSQKIIERALEKGEFDFYECVNLDQLYGECVNTLLKLDAADEDPVVLQRLVQLMGIVKGKIDQVQTMLNPPLPPPMPVAPAPIPAPAVPPAAPLGV